MTRLLKVMGGVESMRVMIPGLNVRIDWQFLILKGIIGLERIS
jgi:hypothetical protein